MILPCDHDFYLSPYLTCGECNSIAFIDSKTIKAALILVDNVSMGLLVEALPQCPGCRRTHAWFVGALELGDHIKGNSRERKQLAKQKNKSAVKVQSIVRSIQARAKAIRIKKEKTTYDAYIYRIASRMAALVKGKMDRRAALVERSLNRIKICHKIVLTEALRPKDGIPVFWYKRKEQVSLLYKNYKVLVERTGNNPPLWRVEENINTIACRVHQIECARAAAIQKRVRGMIGRKFIRQYRIEATYVLGQRVAAVFVLQPIIRGWIAKRRATELKQRQLNTKLLQSYLKERKLAYNSLTKKNLARKLTHAYVVDKAHTYSSDLLHSVYNNKSVQTAAKAKLNREAQIQDQEKLKRIAEWNRQKQIRTITSDNPPIYHAYFKSETDARRIRFMKQIDQYTIFSKKNFNL